MNIYFCGLEEEYAEYLKNSLKINLKSFSKEIIFKKLYYDSEIIYLNDSLQIYFCVPESTVDGLDGIRFSEKIRQQNERAIIIFLSQNLLSAADILKKYICPAGYFLFSELDEAVKLTVSILRQSKGRLKNNDLKMELVCKYKKVTVPLNNVVYFVSCNKKIICYLSNGKNIEFYGTLSDIEKNYSALFIRCHSGYLLNKQKIISVNYTQSYIEVSNSDEKIPISRKYRHQIKDFLNK